MRMVKAQELHRMVDETVPGGALALGRWTKAVLVDGTTHTGVLHSVDPEAGTMLLMRPGDGADRVAPLAVFSHALASLEQSGPPVPMDATVEPVRLVSTEGAAAALDAAGVAARRDALRALLRSNRLPFEQDGEALSVLGCLRIAPPYVARTCMCENETVLGRFLPLLDQLDVPDHAPDPAPSRASAMPAAEGQCWVCCEGSSADRPLLSTGCACRGSAGLAHLDCLVQAAKHDVECWTTCPTCRQEYTGAADVGLARARWALVRERPAEDEERLFVANNLAVTLKESAGDNEGALALLLEVLAVRRRALPPGAPPDAGTIDSMINAALQHLEMGHLTEALPLAEAAVGAARATWGDAHEDTLVAIASLGAVRNGLREYGAARPLLEEALEARRRTLGEGHLETMNSMHLLGQCLVGQGERRAGLELLSEAVTTSRRVLGEAHPSTAHFSEILRTEESGG